MTFAIPELCFANQVFRPLLAPVQQSPQLISETHNDTTKFTNLAHRTHFMHRDTPSADKPTTNLSQI